MITIEDLRSEEPVHSSDVAKLTVEVLRSCVEVLDGSDYWNIYSRKGRFVYGMHLPVKVGVDLDDWENWNIANAIAKKQTRTEWAEICVDPTTERVVSALICGVFPEQELEHKLHTMESVSDSWSARFGFPKSSVKRNRNVVLDTWRNPDREYWERSNQVAVNGSDEKDLAEFEKWRNERLGFDSAGIPVEALDVTHDVFGRNKVVAQDSRRRLSLYLGRFVQATSDVLRHEIIVQQRDAEQNLESVQVD